MAVNAKEIINVNGTYLTISLYSARKEIFVLFILLHINDNLSFNTFNDMVKNINDMH